MLRLELEPLLVSPAVCVCYPQTLHGCLPERHSFLHVAMHVLHNAWQFILDQEAASTAETIQE